ncbi:S8 family serine peptidase [Beggiatoa alba]|uniref:S8 family serine peptidase n=1 Tax=Beggiatoa alba TaxID=1022 RepID=UPI0018DED7B8|nr:S8 family serine peptidase [Beggiatoa alba]
MSIVPVVQAKQVLVHLDTETDSAEVARLYQQGQVIKDLSPLPWLVIEISDSDNQTHLRQISRLPFYTDVRGYFVSATPNDELYTQQWHLDEIGVPTYWETTQGAGVTIALLDSGVDPNHPDLKDNILFSQGYDFGDDDAEPYDANGHGTAMAGLMVAQCNNRIGSCGVAPQTKVIPYKLNQADGGSFSSTTLAAAILAAADSDARIISMSVMLEESAPWVEDALRYAFNKNKILVAAAGNEDLSTVAFPASLPFVVSVGAYTKSHERFGSYGNDLMITAPGTSLWTTQPGTGYVNFYIGTSPAAAIVSASFALLAANNPEKSATELIVQLMQASQDINAIGWDEEAGFGQLHLPTTPSAGNYLAFLPLTQTSYRPNDYLNIDLLLTGLIGQSADLYLRVNLPIAEQRFTLYERFDAEPVLEATPFNDTLQSPFPFTGDIQLSLFGMNGLIIQGALPVGLTEGIYEIDAMLAQNTTQLAYQRQIIWISAD